MPTGANVAVRFDAFEKAALREVAERLHRNQSQTLRELVREALAVLREKDLQKESEIINKKKRNKKKL